MKDHVKPETDDGGNECKKKDGRGLLDKDHLPEAHHTSTDSNLDHEDIRNSGHRVEEADGVSINQWTIATGVKASGIN